MFFVPRRKRILKIMKRHFKKGKFVATICYLIKKNNNGKNSVCLAVKKVSNVCRGKLVGYGGIYEKGKDKSIKAAALRELEEETAGVKALKIKKAGIVTFHNLDEEKKEKSLFIVHVFLATDWRGEPKETEEMGAGIWYPVNRLPLSKLPAADKAWLPRVLRGEKIIGEVWQEKGQSNVLRAKYKAVKKF